MLSGRFAALGATRGFTTDCYRNSPAQSLARSLFTAVEQHAAGQKLADDLTVLVVKRIDADPPPVPDGPPGPPYGAQQLGAGIVSSAAQRSRVSGLGSTMPSNVSTPFVVTRMGRVKSNCSGEISSV